MAPNLERILQLIDEAHATDPNKADSGEPYELHYARKMTKYLDIHTPDADPLLQVAVRAQHFRRWEVPRDSYPKTKPGYFAWRTFLKKRQAEQVKELCLQCDFTADQASRVAALISKEDLKKGEGKGDPEAQILEDCACLVFLVSLSRMTVHVVTHQAKRPQDDQFDKFEAEMRNDTAGSTASDDKIIAILQKTWVKMGKRGQDLALQMDLSPRAKDLIGRALSG